MPCRATIANPGLMKATIGQMVVALQIGRSYVGSNLFTYAHIVQRGNLAL